jgi:membrane protease YdiL (CAAX protease family)
MNILDANVKATWTIIFMTIGFFIYLFPGHGTKLKNYFIKNQGPVRGKISLVLFQRLLGVLMFGLIPSFFILYMFRDNLFIHGLNTYHFTESLLYWAGLSIVLVPINWFASAKPDNLALYPQMKVEEWGSGLIVLSALSWLAYLFAYEFMFRGYLLFTWYHAHGPITAITINTSLYAFAHVHKGAKETIGSIPLGIVLCLITLYTGNFWAAFLTHATLALSNEWFSIYRKNQLKKGA